MSNEPKHTATPNKELNEAAIIAAGLCSHLEAKEQAWFIAGFVTCAKLQSEQTKSELESLRAVNAELIEALRVVKDSAMIPDSVLYLVETTLAKYEKP